MDCPPLGLRWSGAAGAPDHGDPSPLTPRHTFRIASNTKTYVAAAVLRAEEEGLLEVAFLVAQAVLDLGARPGFGDLGRGCRYIDRIELPLLGENRQIAVRD